MEILLLIIFTRKIRKVIKSKGYKTGWFVLLTMILFFGGEAIGGTGGALLALLLDAGDAGIAVVYALALIGAALGGTTAYFIAKSVKPLQFELNRPSSSPAFVNQTIPAAAMPIAHTPGSVWTGMSTTMKILIPLGIGLFIIVVITAVTVGILLYVASHLSSDKELARQEAVKESEGREFGKTTDQEGCMKEGLVQAKTIPIFQLKSNSINRAFVRGCLESSRATPLFCDHIPTDSLVHPSAESDWEDEQCEKIGMDVRETGCTFVFMAKIHFCHDH